MEIVKLTECRILSFEEVRIKFRRMFDDNWKSGRIFFSINIILDILCIQFSYLCGHNFFDSMSTGTIIENSRRKNTNDCNLLVSHKLIQFLIFICHNVFYVISLRIVLCMQWFINAHGYKVNYPSRLTSHGFLFFYFIYCIRIKIK